MSHDPVSRNPGSRRPVSRNPSRRPDRGQATPLWAIVLLLAAMLLVPVGLVAKATVERSRAQSAADAAALAGALEGEDEARAIAAANDARVERYRELGAVVEVVAVVGDRRATARAVREEMSVGPRRRGG